MQWILHENKQVEWVSLRKILTRSKFYETLITVCIPRKKRDCRCGAGREETEGKCDTPGFPLQETPSVQVDHKHSTKLYMPRNHKRVVQTSADLLQSWRANCDVQLLIFNSDPKNPDVMDIARVTDYIVAYSCKGNATMKEEKDHTKAMIMA